MKEEWGDKVTMQCLFCPMTTTATIREQWYRHFRACRLYFLLEKATVFCWTSSWKSFGLLLDFQLEVLRSSVELPAGNHILFVPASILQRYTRRSSGSTEDSELFNLEKFLIPVGEYRTPSVDATIQWKWQRQSTMTATIREEWQRQFDSNDNNLIAMTATIQWQWQWQWPWQWHFPKRKYKRGDLNPQTKPGTGALRHTTPLLWDQLKSIDALAQWVSE